jgi:hypothetical protein
VNNVFTLLLLLQEDMNKDLEQTLFNLEKAKHTRKMYVERCIALCFFVCAREKWVDLERGQL